MRAYAAVEPFGFEIENYRASVIASTVARVHGAKTTASDFYPKINEPVVVREQTQEEQMQILMAAGLVADERKLN